MANPGAEAPYYIVPPCADPVLTLYRDRHCWVVSKPAGLLSVPGRGPENRDSVAWRLQQEDPEVRVVHRLDLDTSGLMVFALSAEAQRRLNRAFAERQVLKRYQAMVSGLPSMDEGEITLPIAADWERRPRQKICHQRGKPSLTRFRVMERDARHLRTRVELTPHTGRSHQLRIHLQQIGHPILGCDLYAPEEVLGASPRLLLHATRLGLHHPRTGLWMEWQSPAPF